jgi:hypothetical protein
MQRPESLSSNLSEPAAPIVGDEDTLGPSTSMLPPPLEGRPSRLSIAAMRRSLVELPIWNPRWKPWSPARVARTAIAFALAMGLLVVLTYKVQKRWAPKTPVIAAALAADEPIVTPSEAAPARADAALVREHRSPIAGGLLTILPSFRSQDGAYDLVLHFHGNTDLVEESFATSGLDAVLVTLNLGNGSGVYEERFANALMLPDVLDRVNTTLEKRGLAHARLGRLALTAWSAGYGAVLDVLAQRSLADKVDAVVLLDGIHAGYKPQSHELETLKIAPFVQFAKEAAAGKKLFSITHSEITPIGNYAGTRETTDALLSAIGMSRAPLGAADPVNTPPLRSIEGVIAKKRLIALNPVTEASAGGLHVRGYAGDQPEHHIAHLVQMSVTALPDLVAWWRR